MKRKSTLPWLKRPIVSTKYMPLVTCVAIGLLALTLAALVNTTQEYRNAVASGHVMLETGSLDAGAWAAQTWLYGVIASWLDGLTKHTLPMVLSFLQLPVAIALTSNIFYEKETNRFWPGLAAVLTCFAVGGPDLICPSPKGIAFIILALAWNIFRNNRGNRHVSLFLMSLILANLWTPAALALYPLMLYGVSDTRDKVKMAAAITIPALFSPGGLYAVWNIEETAAKALDSSSIPLLSLGFIVVVFAIGVSIREASLYPETHRELSIAAGTILVVLFPNDSFFTAALMVPTVISLFHIVKLPDIENTMHNDVKLLAYAMTGVMILASAGAITYMALSHSIGTSPAIAELESQVSAYANPMVDEYDASWLRYHGYDVELLTKEPEPGKYVEDHGITAVIMRSTVENPELAGYLDASPYWTRVESNTHIIWNQIK